MKIFEWSKEIENVYADLIEKAKKENLEEIKQIREEHEKLLADSSQKTQLFVNETLKKLSSTVKEGISLYEKKYLDAITRIKNAYEKDKPDLINKIIKKMGLNLHG